MDNANTSSQPSFLTLPVEIRLQIYRHVFRGAKLNLGIRMPVRTVEQEPYLSISNQKVSVDLLLTCKHIYHEARQTFYESATLHRRTRYSWCPDLALKQKLPLLMRLNLQTLWDDVGFQDEGILSVLPRLKTLVWNRCSDMPALEFRGLAGLDSTGLFWRNASRFGDWSSISKRNTEELEKGEAASGREIDFLGRLELRAEKYDFAVMNPPRLVIVKSIVYLDFKRFKGYLDQNCKLEHAEGFERLAKAK